MFSGSHTRRRSPEAVSPSRDDASRKRPGIRHASADRRSDCGHNTRRRSGHRGVVRRGRATDSGQRSRPTVAVGEAERSPLRPLRGTVRREVAGGEGSLANACVSPGVAAVFQRHSRSMPTNCTRRLSGVASLVSGESAGKNSSIRGGWPVCHAVSNREQASSISPDCDSDRSTALVSRFIAHFSSLDSKRNARTVSKNATRFLPIAYRAPAINGVCKCFKARGGIAVLTGWGVCRQVSSNCRIVSRRSCPDSMSLAALRCGVCPVRLAG